MIKMEALGMRMFRSLVVLILSAPTMVVGLLQAHADAGPFASPQSAVEAHYAALKSVDIDLLRKVHSDVAWFNKEEIARLNSLRLGYKIIKISPMEGQNSHPGDVYVQVEEYFRNASAPAVMHFVLRRIHGSWTIINFNADEQLPEEPSEVVRPSRDRN